MNQNRSLGDARYKKILALLTQALGGGVSVIEAGTPAGQSGAVTDLSVVASTVDAAAMAVDTGYKPAAGHAAGIDGKWIATDRAGHQSRSGNVAATIENYAGAVTLPGHIFGGAQGDGAPISGSVPSLSLSLAGTLVVTFTPNGGYVGTIEWLFNMSATEN